VKGQRYLATTALCRTLAHMDINCFQMRSGGGLLKAAEALFRMGCSPPAKESEEQPQYQLMLHFLLNGVAVFLQSK